LYVSQIRSNYSECITTMFKYVHEFISRLPASPVVKSPIDDDGTFIEDMEDLNSHNSTSNFQKMVELSDAAQDAYMEMCTKIVKRCLIMIVVVKPMPLTDPLDEM